MAFLDIVFRRDSKPPSSPPEQGSPQQQGAARSGGKTKSTSGFYYWSFFIHKWAGLIGAAWLAVLGLTGFFLDHDSWRWLQQDKVPSWLTTSAIEQNSSRNVLRLLQVDPDNRAIEIGGGPRGLWRTSDGGKTWTATAFADGDHPQILAIEPDPAQDWGRLWFGTDNGVYVSEDRGASARQISLKGEYVTALAAGANPSDMLGVVDKSRVFAFSTQEPGKVEFADLSSLQKDERPLDTQLSRFLRDLHFGKGLFDSTSSLVLNDVGGLAMFILSLTGLLYWGLPKWWKSRGPKLKAQGRAPNKTARRATIVWLFRLHSATLGLASVVMLLYLSVTGIFIGHSRELREFLRGTRVPQAYLTPAFAMSSWDGWIDSIVSYPGLPGAFSIGSRLGLFTTADGGQSWAREEEANGAPVAMAQRLRRIGDKVLIANSMAGPAAIRGPDQVSHEVAIDVDHSGHMGSGARAERRGGDGMAGADHARHAGMGGGMNGETRRGMRDSASGDGASAERRSEENGGGTGRQRAMADMGMGGMENMFMPTDVSRSGDKLLWKSSNKLYVTDDNGKQIETLDINQPEDKGTPWFTWLLRVHVGTIFWSEWRWVNDVFAVLAVFLSVTGLIRWWRQKWL